MVKERQKEAIASICFKIKKLSTEYQREQKEKEKKQIWDFQENLKQIQLILFYFTCYKTAPFKKIHTCLGI